MSSNLSKPLAIIKNWWVFLVLGILLIISAIWIFRTPLQSFAGLSIFFSTIIFLSGGLTIFFALANKEDIDHWGLYLAGGVLDVIVGFILLKYPGITIILLSVFVGFWLIFRGANMISSAFKLKKEGGDNWVWVLILGIVTSIFALMAILNPVFGASYLVISLALALLFLGIANIFIGLGIRKTKTFVRDKKNELVDEIKNS